MARPKNSIVNLEPIKKENKLGDRYILNVTVDALKKAFPHHIKMWSVEKLYPNDNLYVDFLREENELEILKKKEIAMKEAGLNYKIEEQLWHGQPLVQI